MTTAQIHKAEEAKQLLANDTLAEALTAVAFEALRVLSAIDPNDTNGIIRQQAIVHVCQELPLMLNAMILRTGEQDGGMTA